MAIADDEHLSWQVGPMRFGAYRKTEDRASWVAYALSFNGSAVVHMRTLNALVVNDFGHLVPSP